MARKPRVKNPRVPRTRGSESYTEAGYWSFIRSGLRAKFSRWPPKYKVLNKAKRTVTGKRHKYEYQCSVCNNWFKQKEVEIDHYPEACGSLKEADDLPRFVTTLFCEEENLRVICKECHRVHTNNERANKKDEV